MLSAKLNSTKKNHEEITNSTKTKMKCHCLIVVC